MDTILFDKGVAYKMSLSLITDTRAAIKDAIEFPPMEAIRIDEDTAVLMDTNKRHVFVKRIRKLRIRAAYSVRRMGDDVIMHPTFKVGLNTSKFIPVPDDVNLVYVNRYRDAGSAGEFLLIMYDSHGSPFVPPLPNIYDDNQLCTGELPSTSYTNVPFNIPDRMRYFEAWQENTWNTDLWHEDIDQQCHKFFRVGLKDEPMPCVGNIHDLRGGSPAFGGVLTKACFTAVCS